MVPWTRASFGSFAVHRVSWHLGREWCPLFRQGDFGRARGVFWRVGTVWTGLFGVRLADSTLETAWG